MLKKIALLSFIFLTSLFAASEQERKLALENYNLQMIQADKDLRQDPKYRELSNALRTALDDLVKQADEMLPTKINQIPQIWPHMATFEKHEDYPQLTKKIKAYIRASNNRTSLFYTRSEAFKKATDQFRKSRGKAPFIPTQFSDQSSQKKQAKQTITPTHQDVKYGAHAKELMNFWQFQSEKPVGVLLQIHGGGWMGGKKDETLKPHQIKQGYSIASISYPLVNEGAQQPEMLNAALRAVQFIRYKAKEWNIDPKRIVVTGGSAGGCSSLLVALHDDVANPESNDPVEHFSSRVTGAMVAGAQTTMNPFIIKEKIGGKTFGNPMPYKPFGAETIQELMNNWDKHKALVLKCSPLTHLTKDDPPLHLFYNVNREYPTTKSPNGIHSPIFGELMLEACKKIGVECHLQYWEKDRPKPAVSREEFLNNLLLYRAI